MINTILSDLITELDTKDDIIVAKNSIQNIGINVVDNVYLLCYALEATRNLQGIYLECGVNKGSTLLTAHEYCKIRNIQKKFIGIDSFNGFPDNKTSNINDKPEMFDKLLSCEKITSHHHSLAKKRLYNHKNNYHLTKEYFRDPGKIIFEESKKRNIDLIHGTFADSLQKLDIPISVFHIDCDLYESYLECLNFQFKNVVNGGIIVLDEYYSLKYPGPRIAVDEFIKKLNINSYSLKMFKTKDFERWCIIKI